MWRAFPTTETVLETARERPTQYARRAQEDINPDPGAPAMEGLRRTRAGQVKVEIPPPPPTVRQSEYVPGRIHKVERVGNAEDPHLARLIHVLSERPQAELSQTISEERARTEQNGP